jgi:RNA 2',3'-cyclic 3'-phosphodiesterase
LPPPAIDACERLLAGLPGRASWSRIRWVRTDGLHLTLRFLGPTDPGMVEELGRVVAAVAQTAAPFEIVLAGGGAFPVLGRPRALWLGVTTGAETLAGLATALAAPLEALGWPADSRPYRPHMTIARSDASRDGGNAARALADAAAGWETRFVADRVTLFESVSGRGAPRYVPIIEQPLQPPDGPTDGPGSAPG